MPLERLLSCPEWELLLALPPDALPEHYRLALDLHLASCAHCVAVRAQFAVLDDLLPAAVAGLPPALLQSWIDAPATPEDGPGAGFADPDLPPDASLDVAHILSQALAPRPAARASSGPASGAASGASPKAGPQEPWPVALDAMATSERALGPVALLLRERRRSRRGALSLGAQRGLMAAVMETPDRPEWRADARYRRDLAPVLRAALIDVEQGYVARARNRIIPWLAMAVASGQHMRMMSVMAHAHEAKRQLPQAVAYLDDALELALAARDPFACAHYAYRRAALSAQMNRWKETVGYYELAFEALYQDWREVDAESCPAEFALDLHTRICAHHFLLSSFATADHHLAAAERMSVALPEGHLLRAEVAWMAALLARWRSDPARAFPRALEALRVYEMAGPASTLARVEMVAADIALDLAERYTAAVDAPERDACLSLARSAGERALSLARSAGDEAGEAVALLLIARLRRLCGINEDRLPTIEAALYTARRLDDGALVVQAHTSLADEFAWRGHIGAACNVYRQAVAVAERSEAPAIGVWAQRALRRTQEMFAN